MAALTDDELVAVLSEYLTILQAHRPAEVMMDLVVTPDFETGFVGGFVWQGLDGLQEFLSQRAGFFDERHEIDKLLERHDGENAVEARRGCTSSCAAGRRPRPSARSSRARASTPGASDMKATAGAWPPSSWRSSKI